MILSALFPPGNVQTYGALASDVADAQSKDAEKNDDS
jgi:hypothetical protein